MDASDCQNALDNALGRELGVEYRKNTNGLFSLIESRRQDAVSNAVRFIKHHETMGNNRPSIMNLRTKIVGFSMSSDRMLGKWVRNEMVS